MPAWKGKKKIQHKISDSLKNKKAMINDYQKRKQWQIEWQWNSPYDLAATQVVVPLQLSSRSRNQTDHLNFKVFAENL